MVSETKFSETLDAALMRRLCDVATQSGQSLDVCLREAVEEYVSGREEFARHLAMLDDQREERVFLRAVGE